MVIERARERGVVALEGAQDLAAHAVVLLTVVADVEVGDAPLGHAVLVGLVLA